MFVESEQGDAKKEAMLNRGYNERVTRAVAWEKADVQRASEWDVETGNRVSKTGDARNGIIYAVLLPLSTTVLALSLLAIPIARGGKSLFMGGRGMSLVWGWWWCVLSPFGAKLGLMGSPQREKAQACKSELTYRTHTVQYLILSHRAAGNFPR